MDMSFRVLATDSSAKTGVKSAYYNYIQTLRAALADVDTSLRQHKKHRRPTNIKCKPMMQNVVLKFYWLAIKSLMAVGWRITLRQFNNKQTHKARCFKMYHTMMLLYN